MSGQSVEGLLSTGQHSTNQALENLDINLGGDKGNHLVDESNDGLMHHGQDHQLSSSKKGEGMDDMAEMEKMLKSGGVFGQSNNLSDTFKKMQEEIGLAEGEDSEQQHEASIEKMSAIESDMDMSLHDNSKLMMESPGQNTFVQNQINDLVNLGGEEAQQMQQLMVADEQSDSNIDIEGLTESQLIALQEQAAAQQEFSEDGINATGMEGEGEGEGEEDEDVIDVDNPEDLAKKGLRRIQIEGDDQEYLLDNEGNIYNLQGEFVGTTGDEDEEGG